MENGLYNVVRKYSHINEDEDFILTIKRQEDDVEYELSIKEKIFSALRLGDEVLVMKPSILGAFQRGGEDWIFLIKRLEEGSH